MKVVEKFTSINGEGTRAGELAVFIRFKGCNLRCSYCDTMWANEPECPYKEETPEEILNYVLGTGIHNVTLTGGEPLMQKDALVELINLLDGFDIALYTGHQREDVPREVISKIKYLKTGPFVEELKTTTTPYVGSTNQTFGEVK